MNSSIGREDQHSIIKIKKMNKSIYENPTNFPKP